MRYLPILFTLLLSSSLWAGGTAVQWTEAEGGNGNWYQAINSGGPTTWNESRNSALDRGGDLTSMETDAEIIWVFNTLASNPDLWYYTGENSGPYLGGFQDTTAPDYDEPGGGWYWLTGTPLQTNYWGPGEPNSPNQDHLHFWSPDTSITMTFDNVEANDSNGGTSYIVEYSADCNGDGIVDYGQILDGTFEDLDGNGVPDICDVTITIDPYEWSTDQGGNGHWYSLLTFAGSVDPDSFYYGENPDSHFAYAESLGGHTATMASSGENAFSYALSNNQHAVLIGILKEEGNNQGGWVTGEPWSYVNWHSGEGIYSWERWGVYFDGGGGTWQDTDFSSRFMSIVEWEADCNGDGIVDYGQILDGTFEDLDGNGVPDCCDAGEPCDGSAPDAVQWTEAEGGNGHWYQPVLGYLQWDEAVDHSASVGGYLATLTTSAEDAFIDGLILVPESDWWIGGFQPEGSPEPGGNWQWVTGETWSFADWAPGEPDDSGSKGPGDEQCLEYNGTGRFIGRISDEKNFQAQPLIIEYSADCNGDGIVDYGQILDGTYEDIDGNGVPDICDVPITIDPYEWSTDQEGNGHWYALLTIVIGPSQSAEEHFVLAESLGGHTATMASAEENEFCFSLNGGLTAFIGVRKEEGTNQGGWITGEPWDYTNWHSGEGTNSGERYANFWGDQTGDPSSQWQDTNLTPGTWSIVEWDADCNGDGIVDYGQILDGTFEDLDGDGVPDCCEDGSCLDDGDPTTSQWTNLAGGDFHDPDNWSTSQPPGAGSTVILELDASYGISFQDDAQTLNLVARSGNVTLDLAGYSYTAANDNSTAIIGESSGDQAVLNVTSGMLEIGSGATGDAELVLGYGDSTLGELRVSGAGASLYVHKLQVGDRGTGLMTIEGGASIQAGRVSLGNFIGSEGRLQLSGSDTSLTAGIEFSVNHGSIDIDSPAELRFVNPDAPMTIFKDGLLTGDGTITGYLLNRGTFAPDMSESAFQVLGDFRNRGVLITTLGETMHSRLEVSSNDEWYGEARLAGGLLVQLDQGFLPEIDAEFEVLLAEDRVRDTFDVAFMPDLGDDRYMTVRYPDPAFRGGEEDVDLVVVGFEDFLGFDEPESVDLDGQPEAMAVGDLDGDGDDDIAVSTPGLISIYFNNNGIFDSSIQVDNGTATTLDLAVGDFNGDELLDLAGANAASDSVTIIISNGDGSFMTAVDYPTGGGSDPQGIAAGDFNNDGRDDLAICCTGTGLVKIWRSQASGGVRDLGFTEDVVVDVGEAPIGIDPGDVEENKDLDRMDLVVALNGEDSVGVLRNVGAKGGVIEFLFDGQQDKYQVGQGPASVALADLDGDGHTDIVTANRLDGTISILLHQDELAADFLPSVELPVGDNARSVSLADLDGDGDQDIALIAVGEEEPTSGLFVLRNDSNLTGYEQLLIAPAETFAITGIPVIVDQGDLDSDGVPDLVTINDASSGLRGAPGSLGLVRSDPAVTCPADLDGNGVVDVDDLLRLLESWNSPYTIDDLLMLLDAWGPCR